MHQCSSPSSALCLIIFIYFFSLSHSSIPIETKVYICVGERRSKRQKRRRDLQVYSYEHILHNAGGPTDAYSRLARSSFLLYLRSCCFNSIPTHLSFATLTACTLLLFAIFSFTHSLLLEARLEAFPYLAQTLATAPLPN